MTIQVGDKLPESKFRVMTAEGPQVKTTDDIFKGKKVALFAVPGAYTGTCHKMHLPSIFLNAYAIKGKGVDTIAITSVNDAFVMNAWKRDTDQRDEATFLADGNAEFTKATCEKACGKFPNMRLADGSYSSANNPTSLARRRSRLYILSASRRRPIRV